MAAADDPWAFVDDSESDEPAPAPVAAVPPKQLMLSPSTHRQAAAMDPGVDLERYKVAELKDMCRERSLPVSGA